MMRALYTAATGMQAQQRNIDTTANNRQTSTPLVLKRVRSSSRIYCITMNATPGFHLQFPLKFR